MGNNFATTKILIVDDDPILLGATVLLLSEQGHDVYEASNGAEALEQAKDVLPDLILLDVMLPDTNGYLLCEKIKSDPVMQSAYIIFLTGNKIDASDQTRGLELGSEGYITRPISNRELLARIEPFIRIKNTEKELQFAYETQSRLNEELFRSNQDLDRFAYAVSHDLKEPLRMVTSFLDLLSRRYAGKLDDTAQTYIDFAVDGSERMQSMIDGLLAFSRVSTKEMVYVSVSGDDILAKALRNLQVAIQESGAQIVVGDLPQFYADESQIIQVFQNLIANAIKYCDKEAPQVKISVALDAQDLLFSVADNGLGIDPQNHARVFEFFQRLHTGDEFQGVGIGLALCKRIIERHGGRIWVESQAGNGAIFYFSIPQNNNMPENNESQ